MRAFADGCTAITGVEAVSNGVPAFQRPESRNARIDADRDGVLVGIMFLGTTWLAASRGPAVRPGDGPVAVRPRRVRRGRAAVLRAAALDDGHPDPRRQHGIRRLPAPLVAPGARRLHAQSVRVPRRAPGVHDRDRRPRARSRSWSSPSSAVGSKPSSRSTRSVCSRPSRCPRPAWSATGRLRARPAGAGASPSTAPGRSRPAIVTVIFAIAKFGLGAWLVIIVIPVLVAAMLLVHRRYERRRLDVAVAPRRSSARRADRSGSSSRSPTSPATSSTRSRSRGRCPTT